MLRLFLFELHYDALNFSAGMYGCEGGYATADAVDNCKLSPEDWPDDENVSAAEILILKFFFQLHLALSTSDFNLFSEENSAFLDELLSESSFPYQSPDSADSGNHSPTSSSSEVSQVRTNLTFRAVFRA